MPFAPKDVPATARTAGLVVPVVIALVACLTIVIAGSLMALRGPVGAGRSTELQQAARSGPSAQKSSFSEP